jgi:chaperonin GroES
VAEGGPGRRPDAANDDQAPHTFLEQHRLWDLDGDDYPEPYIVTVHKETQQGGAHRRPLRREGLIAADGTVASASSRTAFTKYGVHPLAGRQLLRHRLRDAAGPARRPSTRPSTSFWTPATWPTCRAGSSATGVSIKSGRMRFDPGEWKKAGSSGASLKDNIVPLPVKEPSAVLFNLLGLLIEAAKDVTATQDILTGDDTVQANQPVGTTLALIEQGLKTFTAIVKRIHRALKPS